MKTVQTRDIVVQVILGTCFCRKTWQTNNE